MAGQADSPRRDRELSVVAPPIPIEPAQLPGPCINKEGPNGGTDVSLVRHVFVGIDVAKDWLDIAVRPTGAAWRVAQDDEGIADLVRQLAKLQPKLIVMEASGGYERLSAIALDAARRPWPS